MAVVEPVAEPALGIAVALVVPRSHIAPRYEMPAVGLLYPFDLPARDAHELPVGIAIPNPYVL